MAVTEPEEAVIGRCVELGNETFQEAVIGRCVELGNETFHEL